MRIKYTYVDALTRIPCTEGPMVNGPDTPVPVAHGFANESQWPTATPIMYGTATDDTETDTLGILQVLTEEEYAQALAEEMTARRGQMVVTPRQARLALLDAGLLDTVEAAVSESDQAAKIAWEFATEIKRLDPLVVGLCASLGMDDESVDGLFAAAARL